MAEHLYRKRISPAPASNVDDIVSKNVLAQLRRDPPPRPPAHLDAPKGGAGPKPEPLEASDLISSMAKRLAALEREMKERQALVQQVQTDNAALKSKLKVRVAPGFTAARTRTDSEANSVRGSRHNLGWHLGVSPCWHAPLS